MQFHSPVRFRCISRSLLGLALLSCALDAPIARGDDTIDKGTFSLQFENDAFADKDRYYTSGVKLGWSSLDLRNNEFAGLLPFIDDERYQRHLMLAFGQDMFTPDDKDSFVPVPGDRPYAGWLYGGVGFAWQDANVRNTFMLNVGVVGSWALAEETQNFFHTFNSSAANGWDHQLRNELGIVAAYDRTWRWPHERRAGLGWDLLPNVGVAVGNVLTAANAGLEIRFGLNLPDDFGTRGINFSTATSTPMEGAGGRFGIYAFARADGRAVAHNIFLDGNTFADSISVDKEPFVADLSVGLAMTFKRTRIAYAFVYRTEEFETQDEAQVYGTLSINWSF